MYDKSLEQLIDVVIADGIITDQERKVVYKKAAILGIDQDEIEVYLNGRLEVYNNNNAPKSNKHGSIRTCPNCGAVVDSIAGKCSECGYNFVDIESNRTTKQLQKELEKIDNKSKSSINDSVLSLWGQDKNTQSKIQLIKNFTIPNTKADLIEFTMLCYTNLNVKAATNSEIELRKAWTAKAKELEAKANILFPKDKEVLSAISLLSIERKNFFKSNQYTIRALVGIAILVLVFSVLGIFVGKSSKESEKYTIEKLQEIKSLPSPDTQNYKECFRQFSNILWTENKHDKGYQTFVEAQIAYRDLLVIAYKEAGVSEDMIPQSLLLIGHDLTNEKTESEAMVDSTIIQKEFID